MQILKHLNKPKNKEKLDSRRKCEAPVRWCSDLIVEWTHVKLWFDLADAELLPSETLCLSQGPQPVASNLDVWMRESSVISFSRLLPVALSWDARLREKRYQTVNVREKRGAVPVADQKCMVQCHCCAFLLHLSHPIQVLKTPPWNQNTATILTYDPLKLLKLNPCLTTTHLKPTLCQQIWC